MLNFITASIIDGMDKTQLAWHTQLGHDIRDARRRRRIPLALMAERASISRTSLNKVEKGHPGVSVGSYATVLLTLAMADRLPDVANPRYHTLGLELEASAATTNPALASKSPTPENTGAP
jgi:hypothetical protein